MNDELPKNGIYSEELKVIKRIPAFAGLQESEQHLIAVRCNIINLPADQLIIEEGDIADNLYAIIEGFVIVYKHQSSGWVKINTLCPGAIFGEIAILHRIRRTARVVTKTPVRLLSINQHDFLEIYQFLSANARDNIQEVMAKRIQHLRDMGIKYEKHQIVYTLRS